MRKAKDASRPAWSRIVEYAKARANLWGHAHATVDELRALLANKTGKPMSRQKVYDAMKQAVRFGDLAPVSTVRCLVLLRDEWTRGYGRAAPCREASHAGHRWHEYRRDHGWTLWEPPEELAAAMVAGMERESWAFFDQASGQWIDPATGEAVG